MLSSYQNTIELIYYFYSLIAWIVENPYFIKINEGTKIPIDDTEGFLYVGHVEGVENIHEDKKDGSENISE